MTKSAAKKKKQAKPSREERQHAQAVTELALPPEQLDPAKMGGFIESTDPTKLYGPKAMTADGDVVRYKRADYISFMLGRGKINKIQHDTARCFEADMAWFVANRIKGASFEAPVDGGGGEMGTAPLDAGRRLKGAQRLVEAKLGAVGWLVLRAVAGLGSGLGEVKANAGEALTYYDERAIGSILVHALDEAEPCYRKRRSTLGNSM